MFCSDGLPEERSVVASCACGTQRLRATWATHHGRVGQSPALREPVSAASLAKRLFVRRMPFAADHCRRLCSSMPQDNRSVPSFSERHSND